MWNVRVLWPQGAKFVFNTYKGPAPLIITDSTTHMYSTEGVAQGDPVAMIIYALASLPLICRLKGHGVTQAWYADDAPACGPIEKLHHWFDTLQKDGPKFGYFPQPHKCKLVVSASHIDHARDIFRDTGIHITTHHKFLGGSLGESDASTLHTQTQVDGWCSATERLARIAVTHPHLSYAALVRSLSKQWNHFQRITPHCSDAFTPLEHAIHNTLIPTLLDGSASTAERRLLALPTRFGGLDIPDPSTTAEHAHHTSKNSSRHAIAAIKGIVEFSLDTHTQIIREARKEFRSTDNSWKESEYTALKEELQPKTVRCMERARAFKTSSWLNLQPTESNNNNLSKHEFTDALNIRFGRHSFQ
eukprot:GHVR01108336.1.p1 GENE.GHVR01108336.1~~GHVR01108336.1.p1  ORF type:complete len:360 (+),score=49.29 GHVR01108336.1:613-1692(+)